MEHKEIIDSIKPEMDKVVSFFYRELDKIRTGRASLSLVEDITADCFGQKFLIKQLGAITLSGPQQILIQPWDKSYLESIESAIRQSGRGLSPVVDKDAIRINLSTLTGEFRDNLLKVLSEKQEEAKMTIRRWREEAWKKIQDGFKDGEIREDDKFRAKDMLQEIVDEYYKKIEDFGDRKRKEING